MPQNTSEPEVPPVEVGIELSETRKIKLTQAILLQLLRRNGFDVPDTTKFTLVRDLPADWEPDDRGDFDAEIPFDETTVVVAEYVANSATTQKLPRSRRKTQ